MNLVEISKAALEQLLEKGAQQAQVISSHTFLDELMFENDDFTLLRSVEDQGLDLTAIIDNKKGSYSSSDTTAESLEKAAAQTLEIANSGQADEAYAIATKEDQVAPAVEKVEFGPAQADPEAMTKLIQNFVKETSDQYPKIGLRSVTVQFIKTKSHYLNSHGIEVQSSKGYYNFSAMFNAQDGDKSSSMDYDFLSFSDFGPKTENLLATEKFGGVFKNMLLHLDAKKVEKSFTGNAIFMPKCWQSFLGMVLGHLGTSTLLAGTSKLEGKIGEQVGSELFHIESRPQDPMFTSPSVLTGDGVFTKDMTIFEKGTLKTYLVDLYGRNKLGLKEVSNFASKIYMPKGETNFDDMIKGIGNGILIGRFSGGAPNSNGDFSGIAKNSFIIKEGKVDQALSETMISGNVFDLIKEIYATSTEVYENGSCHLPYVASKGITIS